MSNAIKFNALRGREIPAFGILVLAVITALLPITAQAQCSGIWDASGKWSFMQRNATRPVELTMGQNGKAIFGSAAHIIPGSRGTIFSPGAYGESKTGKVDGTILGDRFSIEISWNGGAIGVYNARVLSSGRLEGEGYEKSSPNVRHPWNSTGVLKCVPASPPAVIPKVIRSSGKARPAPTPAPQSKPPYIIAGQPVIPPYMYYGTVNLGWEGGPDHPNVEVWLSMDNGAEIPAFSMEHVSQSPVWKQPKMASIPLKLQRNHHYKFVLKAAGRTLSTAEFVVP